MVIRSFRLSDYAAIMEIWKETGLAYEDMESMDAIAKQLAWDSELVLVAELDENVVGVIVGTIDRGRAYFYRLAVLKAYQKRGIGRGLVQALEERLQKRGAYQIFIMVNQKNEKVIPFYQSLGYDVERYITMSKKL
ncbi:GNAT family N-acetyltransferase [Rubeoparvulum massiliense]|uniref:GNAT family N-acetyltransferase n=1 Tax=Rubeoparvulum massiliense TaxID=1631346 RepID=UPI00065E6E53|nr:GNAT family N-acetyltransferase [Rubeoparvulum massiliense]